MAMARKLLAVLYQEITSSLIDNVGSIYRAIRWGIRYGEDPDKTFETAYGYSFSNYHTIPKEKTEQLIRLDDYTFRSLALLVLMAKSPDYDEAVRLLSKPKAETQAAIFKIIADTEPERKVRRLIKEIREDLGLEPDGSEENDRKTELILNSRK